MVNGSSCTTCGTKSFKTSSILSKIFPGNKAADSTATPVEECCYPKIDTITRARVELILDSLIPLMTAEEWDSLVDSLICCLGCNTEVNCTNAADIYTQIDTFLCQALGIGFTFTITEGTCAPTSTCASCTVLIGTTVCGDTGIVPSCVESTACSSDEAWTEAVELASQLIPGGIIIA